ncbi:MAG: alpha/beta hydrolase [Patescibacteria group bacterium]
MHFKLNNLKLKWSWKFVGLLTLIFGLIGLAYLGFWLSTPYQPDQVAVAALNSGAGINVKLDSDLILFQKEQVDLKQGVILYPGGRVKPEAYAQLCRKLAEKYGLCAIVKMTFNLAIVSPNNGDKLIQKFPTIQNWMVVSHSLGGPAAARFIQSGQDKISELVLLASYSDVNINSNKIKVLSISGSKDEVMKAELLQKNSKNLPSNAKYEVIQGGNHAQMGNYGAQDGDGTADIDSANQKELVLNLIQNWSSFELLDN